MKNQQQAEKEEQQRIKNLVLNYDLQQNDDHQEGKVTLPAFPQHLYLRSGLVHTERPVQFHHNRVERPKDRGQRVRKLQLSDVDW